MSKTDWYCRLPKAEQEAVDSLRQQGYYVDNRFS